MPRTARLFASSSGSAARGFLKFRANIPPRWIKNAQKSRKRIEPAIVEALQSVISIRRNRPRAQVALKKANHDFKAVLSRWETAYNKENFYRGIRILLELQRNGSSKLLLSQPIISSACREHTPDEFARLFAVPVGGSRGVTATPKSLFHCGR